MEVRTEPFLNPGWLVSSVKPPDLLATFIVKGTFALKHDGRATPHPDPLYLDGDMEEAGVEGSLRYESDFALFKPRADLLLVGTCHAPGGRPATHVKVVFGVGALRKSLIVTGDRQWEAGLVVSRCSDPVPFLQMPIGYQRAFGGPEHGWNRIGRGYEDGRLPNVEHPEALVRSPSSKPPPAGLGPISRSWPERAGRTGTYKGGWLEKRWPWPPVDFDWSYYNAAPRDQQVEGYLVGDEDLLVENLHRDHARYVSRLPGIRPLLFVLERKADERRVWSRIELNLDTLWVDMDAETLVLVWRGRARVQTLKLKEVLELHVVARNVEEPAWSAGEYAAEVERLAVEAREEQAREAAEEEAASRESERESRELTEEMERLVAGAEARAAELAGQVSAPSGAVPAPVSMGEEDLKAFERRLESTSLDPALALLATEGLELDLPPEFAEVEPEPWTRSRCETHAAARGRFAGADLSALDLGGLDLSGLDLTDAVLAGAELSGSRLVGADLSRANLDRAILSGADLSKATLTDASATEANFSRARLGGAELGGAIMSRASLVDADLRDAAGERADFTGADLTGAVFASGRFPDARFSGCKAQGADFTRAILARSWFENVTGHGIIMEGADLAELRAGEASDFLRGRFRECRAAGSSWGDARLEGADFRRATLADADFSGASLVRARLGVADLSRARFEEADLEQASLVMINGFRASFERALLRDADLRGANLFEAEFWQARLEGTRLDGANLKMTKLG